MTFGHFEAHVANAVVPNARLCARYTSPVVICRVFSHLHRVSCAVVHSRRRTSEKVSHLPDCLFSSLWWLSIEVIPPRRRRLNDMTRMCMVETKSSCRFCGTHRDFRDRAIGHLTYICPKMAFLPTYATSLLQFGGCCLAKCDRKWFVTYQMAILLKMAQIPRKRRAVGLKIRHLAHPFFRPRPP